MYNRGGYSRQPQPQDLCPSLGTKVMSCLLSDLSGILHVFNGQWGLSLSYVLITWTL